MDGGVALKFDNYPAAPGWVTRSVTGLGTDRGHSISVIPRGSKSAASTGTSVTVDRFDIG